MISKNAPANAASLPNTAPSRSAGGRGPKSLKPKYLLKFKTSKEDQGVILTGLFEKVYSDGTKSFGGKNRDTGVKYGLFFNEAKNGKPASVVVKCQTEAEGKWTMVAEVKEINGKYGKFFVGDGTLNGQTGSFYVSESKPIEAG